MKRPIAAIAVSVAALLATTLTVAPPAMAQSAQFCAPGQSPAFVLGIGALHERLGATMGVPLECEHINADNGDTIQHTSTGLAYYRPEINTPMFTDGQTHWGLSGNQLLMWRSSSVVPPQPTARESTYLLTARPLARQLDTMQRQVMYIHSLASAGRIDAVDVSEIGALYDELSTARDAMLRAPSSDRLSAYDDLLVNAYEESVQGAELLLRARLTSIPEARAAFIQEAASRIDESNRLQRSANDAYSLALPVVVG